MNGGVRIRTELDARGETRIVELAAESPLAAKVTAGCVHLIGTAAAPLDGDRILIDLEVGAGTQLMVRTVAATLAWPGAPGAVPSEMEIRARVGDGASLQWLPEPLVPVRGCHHELLCDVQLAGSARLVWREEIVLGRAGEGPGTLNARTRVTRAGTPLLHQELAIDGVGTAHRSGALLAGARATGGLLVVGPGTAPATPPESGPELRTAVLQLEHGGRLASATGASVVALRRWLDAQEEAVLADPEWHSSGTLTTSPAEAPSGLHGGSVRSSGAPAADSPESPRAVLRTDPTPLRR